MTVLEDVGAALARLDAVRDLGAVVARDDEAAMAAAAALDSAPAEDRATWNDDAQRHAQRQHPLRGTAVTVKDWIDVAGLPCEGENTERTGRVPERDATAVARLRAAGAVVVAKTQPGPHHPLHGQCLHPLDPLRSPGGSSTGEAVLVAAGASRLGLGSDSGGSIRLPAAWCGVVGLKPSFGRVPGTGHFPEIGGHQDGRTVIGPLAGRVADAGTALRVIAGPDRADWSCPPVPLRDPASAQAEGLRVAVVRGEGSWLPSSATADAVERAASALAARGVAVRDDLLPAHLAASLDVTLRYWGRSSLSGGQVQRQLQDWDRLCRRLDAAAQAFDAVVGPTVADVAPPLRDITAEDFVFTLPWSLTGWPAVSVPAGRDGATGLPLAVQVAAPRWQDHVALAVAGWLESDLGVG